MDKDERRRRPWWRKRRWRLVVVAWLGFPIAYPLSVGPAGYACRGGWLPVEVYNGLWGRPLKACLPPAVKQVTGYQAYLESWVALARKHFPQD